jgi:hypothetical protein
MALTVPLAAQTARLRQAETEDRPAALALPAETVPPWAVTMPWTMANLPVAGAGQRRARKNLSNTRSSLPSGGGPRSATSTTTRQARPRRCRYVPAAYFAALSARSATPARSTRRPAPAAGRRQRQAHLVVAKTLRGQGRPDHFFQRRPFQVGCTRLRALSSRLPPAGSGARPRRAPSARAGVFRHRRAVVQQGGC